MRAESWALSQRQGDRQVGHPGRLARRRRVAMRTCCERAGLLLLHRAVCRLKVRHSDPEDRQQLQGVHVSRTNRKRQAKMFTNKFSTQA